MPKVHLTSDQVQFNDPERMTFNGQDFISLNAIANQSGAKLSTLQSYVNKGILKGRKLGRKTWISAAVLAEFLAGCDFLDI